MKDRDTRVLRHGCGTEPWAMLARKMGKKFFSKLQSKPSEMSMNGVWWCLVVMMLLLTKLTLITAACASVFGAAYVGWVALTALALKKGYDDVDHKILLPAQLLEQCKERR